MICSKVALVWVWVKLDQMTSRGFQPYPAIFNNHAVILDSFWLQITWEREKKKQTTHYYLIFFPLKLLF